jgi:hypothetical protein
LARDLVELEAAFFFLPFFFGRSHSHSGINESTCVKKREGTPQSSEMTTMRVTHESNIRKQFRKYPDARTRDDDGDDVEYKSNDRNPKKDPDQTQHAYAEIPYPQTHDWRPQGEHDATEHDGDHREAARVRRPLRPLVEPRVVLVWRERLLGDDLEGLE